MLIKDDKVEAIFEYDTRKMVLSVYPTDILVVHDMKLIKVIKKISPGNFNKHWLLPLPNSDSKSGPVLVCSGRESFTLINLNDARIETLIKSPCMCVGPQQAFFFKKEEFGYTMHFTSTELNDNNLEYQKYYVMSFK